MRGTQATGVAVVPAAVHYSMYGNRAVTTLLILQAAVQEGWEEAVIREAVTLGIRVLLAVRGRLRRLPLWGIILRVARLETGETGVLEAALETLASLGVRALPLNLIHVRV
jgi:hypothetical protein